MVPSCSIHVSSAPFPTCSTFTAPRAAQTSPTPPDSNELRKSSACFGGMAMMTSCFRSVAVYISKSHQTCEPTGNRWWLLWCWWCWWWWWWWLLLLLLVI